MYKALILDDEDRALRVLLHALKAHPKLSIVATCQDLSSTRKALQQHRPDILFLDIEVEGQKVFPLINEIWSSGQSPSIVFVTGWGKKYLNEAMLSCEQLFQWSYLMKPIQDNKLATVIQKFISAQEQQTNTAPKRLLVQSGSREFYINYDEIVHCESDGNYVNIFQLQDSKLIKRIWSGSLKRLLQEKLDTPDFVQISSKHAINRNFLKGSADRRVLCVLFRQGMQVEVKLRVPEKRRTQVWQELLNE
jgi:two-component system LytT family response regulator